MRFTLLLGAVLCLCGTAAAQSNATVSQAGDGHAATQAQMIEDRFDGPVQLNATIHQQTSGNTAIQVQTYDASLHGGLMEAEITQSGVGNEASQIQIGGVSVFASVFQEGGAYGPNRSFQEQRGQELSGIVSQIGHMNLSVVTQTGASHAAVVTQHGANNTATITQSN